jgi:hypothetical protein
MLRPTLACSGAMFLALALASAAPSTAGAQTQMQGKTVGSPPPASTPPATTPPASPAPNPKAKRAECTSKAKDQGLKGRELTKFVRECMKKSE